MPKTKRVLIRNPDTGEERRVAEAAIPFFPGYQPVTPAAKHTTRSRTSGEDKKGADDGDADR